jgi:hypothetical protein
VEAVLMHGHQFDLYANPLTAPDVGETASECIGLFFQGPDREWHWEDDVARWVDGRRTFNNELVEDADPMEVASRNRPVMPRARAALPLLAGPSGDGRFAQDFFEWLFKHRVAWEYFEKPPLAAVQHEVLTGQEFFKLRHLDEEVVARGFEDAFGDTGRTPRLVLGHSHEVRCLPLSRKQANRIADFYYNTGSAGRFRWLVWGLEIEDGDFRLVAWVRKPLHPAGWVLERRIVTPVTLGPDAAPPERPGLRRLEIGQDAVPLS